MKSLLQIYNDSLVDQTGLKAYIGDDICFNNIYDTGSYTIVQIKPAIKLLFPLHNGKRVEYDYGPHSINPIFNIVKK